MFNKQPVSGGFRGWVRTNQALGVLLTLVLFGLLVYFLLSPWVYREQHDGFLLGFFPVFSAVLMLIFSLVLVMDSFKKQPIQDSDDAALAIGWRVALYAVIILVAWWLYMRAVMVTGFLIVTPPFLFIFTYILGARPWWLVTISAIGVTGLVYLGFRSLGFDLPPGLLPF